MRGNTLLKWFDFYFGSFIILLLSAFSKRKWQHDANDRPFQKILVIKLAALGDTILLIPTLRALRRKYPRAHIGMICTSINEGLVGLLPRYVDRSFNFDVRRVFKESSYFTQFVKTLRTEHFEVVIDFEQWSFITPIICHLAKIPLKIGFQIHRPTRHLIYDHSFQRQQNKHESENFLGVLSVLGIKETSTQPELPVSKKLVKQVKKELTSQGRTKSQKLVVIHPGCGAHGFPREWPLVSYKQLCSKLSAEFNLFFVFTGSEVEQTLKEELGKSMPLNSYVWMDPNIEKFIAVVSISNLFISGNNGPMHIAAALKRPQIALDGPNDSRKWGPLSKKAVVIRSACPGCPCLDLGFEYHRTDGFCMAQILVPDVYRVARRLLHS